MSNFIKIKDMSSKYGISARTLRYYDAKDKAKNFKFQIIRK